MSGWVQDWPEVSETDLKRGAFALSETEQAKEAVACMSALAGVSAQN